jgi:hypothetical protein
MDHQTPQARIQRGQHADTPTRPYAGHADTPTRFPSRRQGFFGKTTYHMAQVRRRQFTQTRKKRVLSAPETASRTDAYPARARTLHSRPPLYRFQEILHAIRSGRYPNRAKLAAQIEVTTKTIQRDLDYMRYK